MGEGIVRIINPKGVTKVIVIRITDWSLVQFQPGPPKRFEKVQKAGKV